VRSRPAIFVDLTPYLLERHEPDFDNSDFENAPADESALLEQPL
jgi:hypothetical protein